MSEIRDTRDICPVETSSQPCELAQEKGMDCCAECLGEYVVILEHPNLGSLWVGFIGTKDKVIEYLKSKDFDLSYLSTILPVDGSWDSREFGEVHHKDFGLKFDESIDEESTFTLSEVEEGRK